MSDFNYKAAFQRHYPSTVLCISFGEVENRDRYAVWHSEKRQFVTNGHPSPQRAWSEAYARMPERLRCEQ